MLTDDDRKVIDDYMGHIRINPHHGSCCTCRRCGQFHDACWCTEYDTIEDLHTVYSRMVELGEWRAFGEVAYIKWLSTIKSAKGLTPHEFNAWLFCLNAPDQIPERCKMVAEWMKGK